ncbi:unnamed protein product, partial [Owenia fusiformis]
SNYKAVLSRSNVTHSLFVYVLRMAGERWIFTKQQLINTPSRKAGIDADKELSYRQQAANFIQDMGQRLQVQQLVINTSIVYMHRFYMFHSFAKFHRNQIATAAIFLGAKVEEQPRKLEHVIRVAHICLHREGPPLDTKSEAYLDQAQELVINENILLQTLGFNIVVEHPHSYIVKTCHVVKASKDLSQTSYFLATNSLHLTTMCLQYPPTLVACLCIHLACTWSDWKLGKSADGNEWYHFVDKTVTTEKLDELTQEFLAIIEKCPSKLRKKILTWKNQAQSHSASTSGPSPSHKRVKQEAPSVTGSSTSQHGSQERKNTPSPNPSSKHSSQSSKHGSHSSRTSTPTAPSSNKSRSSTPASSQESMKRVKSDSNLTPKNYKEYKELKEKGMLPDKTTPSKSSATSKTEHDNIFDQYKVPGETSEGKVNSREHEGLKLKIKKEERNNSHSESSKMKREKSRDSSHFEGSSSSKQKELTPENAKSTEKLVLKLDPSRKKLEPGELPDSPPSYPKIKIKNEYPDLNRVKREDGSKKSEHSGSKNASPYPKIKLKTEYPDLSKAKQEAHPDQLRAAKESYHSADNRRSDQVKSRHSDFSRDKVKSEHHRPPGSSSSWHSSQGRLPGGPEPHRHPGAHRSSGYTAGNTQPHAGPPSSLDYSVHSDKHFSKLKQESRRDGAPHAQGHPGHHPTHHPSNDPYRQPPGSSDKYHSSRKRPLSSPEMSAPPQSFTSPHKQPRNNTSHYDQRNDSNGKHASQYGQHPRPGMHEHLDTIDPMNSLGLSSLSSFEDYDLNDSSQPSQYREYPQQHIPPR